MTTPWWAALPRINLFLFTFADGVTAAGVGTTRHAAEGWLRGVARPPYDAMKVVDCEDYQYMTEARKAAVARRHAARNYAAACPRCGAVHPCEPWATEVCGACRRHGRAAARPGSERAP